MRPKTVQLFYYFWYMKQIYLGCLLAILVSCTDQIPQAYGPVPTPEQLEWQKMEFNMFCHFGPNTFTGKEWGDGTETEDIFNPTSLDCSQWVDVANGAGMKGIIITAKHHDGFCLWPNPVCSHTVAQSVWKEGKGDVLKELSEACAAGGLKFGVYISPWDRNDSNYGSPAYNEVYRRTLESALSSYGPVFEQWFDGACGEGPNGKVQVYDWPLFHQEVRKNQPHAIMFSDVGPGCRWMGNEKGVAGRTNWSRLDIDGREPGSNSPATDTLNQGNYNGAQWIPAETDVSIRKGWFYRSSEEPKSLKQLLDIYYSSVGRNSLLLLNVPPDTRGLIPAQDSARLVEFRAALDEIFGVNLAEGAKVKADVSRCGKSFRAKNILDKEYDTYWAAPDATSSAILEVELPEARTFNRVMIQEYIPLGQRVESFHIEALLENGQWKTITQETTIGYKRIVLTEQTTAKSLRLVIDSSRACPLINNFALYYDKF